MQPLSSAPPPLTSLLRSSGIGEGTCETCGWTLCHFLAAMGSIAVWRTSVSPPEDSSSSLVERYYHRFDQKGRTPLHICCMYDHHEVLQAMLDEGADPTVGMSSTGCLSVALDRDSWWCVQAIVLWHFTPSASPPTDRDIESLLSYRWTPKRSSNSNSDKQHTEDGTWYGSIESCNLLLIACNEPSLHPLALRLCSLTPSLSHQAVISVKHETAMHAAAGSLACTSNAELMTALLRSDADGVGLCTPLQDGSGRYPVHLLARSGCCSAMTSWFTKTLHACCQATHPHAFVDAKGWNVLHHASDVLAATGDVRHVEMIRLLTKTFGMSMRDNTINHLNHDNDDAGEERQSSSATTHLITGREIISASCFAARLLPLVDALDEYYASHEF